MDNIEIKPGIYRHYKGKDYEVIGLARHSETEEPVVVYRALYETSYGTDSLWVRPYEMFTEQITVGGEKISRFTYTGDAKDEK